MLQLILVEHDMTEQESYFTFFHSYEKKIVNVVCAIQLVLTLIFFTLWLTMRLPLCLDKRRKKLEEEAEAA